MRKKLPLVLVYVLLLPTGLLAQTLTIADHARHLYNQGSYQESAETYVEAIQHGDRTPDTAYNAACSFALAGDVEQALTYVKQSVDFGWMNDEWMQKDGDLESIRSHPDWETIVEGARENARRHQQLWNADAIASPYNPAISIDAKLAGLSLVWSEVKYNFVNFDLVPDLNWDSLYVSYIPRIRKSETTLEYYKLLTEFIAHLNDAHTNVYYPRELFAEAYSRPPLITRKIEGKVIVVEVFSEEVANLGVKVGDELKTVDGMNVEDYANVHVKPYQSSSTPQDEDVRSFSYALLSGSNEKPVALELVRPDETGYSVRVNRITPEERSKIRPASNSFEFATLKDNISYVQLNSFSSNDVVEMFDKHFDEISESDGLIIDIRNNGGGNSGNGWAILGYLADSSFTTSGWYTREYKPATRAWGQPQSTFGFPAGSWYSDSTKYYDGPVAVLTSARTFSAAEDFAVAFQAMGRGPIVGEATGGSTGQPLFFELPGGGNGRVCTKRDYHPNGLEFVGIGVQPDIQVFETVDGLRNGEDEALTRAIREIRKSVD